MPQETMFVVIPFVLLINCYLTLSSPYNDQYLDRPVKLCGKKLTEALSWVCDGFYPEIKKSKSDISDLDEYEFQNDVIYGNEILRPYRPYLQKETVKNYPYKHRLNKRQVAEDCCRKACTREYIKNTYCGYRRENTH